MNGEVLRNLGRAVFIEIVWGCAKQASTGCQAARNQAGVFQFGDADDEIETLVDNVDEAIRQVERYLHLRVLTQVSGNRLLQMQDAKRGRCAQREPAARFAGLCRRNGLGFIDVLQDIDATLQVYLADSR